MILGKGQSNEARNTGRILGLVAWVLRVFLGGVFIVAAVPKMVGLASFANALNAYRILPPYMLGITALLLPLVECALGLLLIFGLYLRCSLACAAGLLIVFTVAVGSAMARGLSIDCGCFGHFEPVGWSVITRDVGMLGVTAVLYWGRSMESQR